MEREVPRNTQYTAAKHLLNTGLHHDVTFKVGENGDLIKAHRLILAQRSPVFESMLFGRFTEKSSPVIDIEDVDTTGFGCLLR